MKNNILKLVIYSLLMVFTVAVLNQYFYDKYAPVTDYRLYLTNTIDEESALNELKENNINIIISDYNHFKGITNTLLPKYILKSNKITKISEIKPSSNLYVRSDYDISTTKSKLEDILGQDVNLLEDKKATSSLADIQNVIVMLVILFTTSLIIILTALVSKQNEIFIKILNGHKKRSIIKNLAKLLTLKSYIFTSFVLMIILIIITFPFPYYIIYIGIICLSSIILIELLLYCILDIFYESIIRSVSKNFLNRKIKARILPKIMLLLIFLVSFIIANIGSNFIYNFATFYANYTIYDKYEEKFDNMYYTNGMSSDIVERQNNTEKILYTDNIKAYTYDIDLVTNILYISKNYLYNTYKIKVEPNTLIVFNNGICDEKVRTIMTDFGLEKCISTDINNNNSFAIIQENTISSNMFYDSKDYDNFKTTLNQLKLKTNYFQFAGKFGEYKIAMKNQAISELVLSLIGFITLIFIFVFTLANYILVTVLIYSDKLIYKIFNGELFWKRNKSIIINLIVNYSIAILILYYFVETKIYLLPMYLIMLILSLLLLKIIERNFVVRKLTTKIKSI